MGPSKEGVTGRAILFGVLGTIAVIVWIHIAELVLGGARGHTALANTSIPVGAFCALSLLFGINALVGKFRPGMKMKRQELLTSYIMMTSATVLASSGGIHFLVPAMTAAFYFASPENGWERFHRYIPSWFGPRDSHLLRGFYEGDSWVPVLKWLVPVLFWSFFLILFTFSTICICVILRKQWVDREKLVFPTVVLPLEMTKEGTGFWKDRMMWIGFLIAFFIGTINTASLNIPAIPSIKVRPTDISGYFTERPWNAIGYTPVSFYPFVIGIGYLLSLEVSFSCWFFYILTKVQLVFGAMMGWYGGGATSLARFPFLGHQGAGAFLALTALSLWIGRGHLRKVLFTTVRKDGDEGEPLPYRWAVIGFMGSTLVLLSLFIASGISPIPPLLLLFFALFYMIAATRVRAETGNAWLFGPQVDPHLLVMTTFGTRAFSDRDLTIMAYLRSITTFDLRCLSMPHQLDGFKMAQSAGMNPRKVLKAMIMSITVGTIFAFWSGLFIWHRYGALARTDAWRTTMGMQPFVELQGELENPSRPDIYGLAFVSIGAILTWFLSFMRSRFLWWPFHPVGYAMANTFTMAQLWMPFLIAWLVKSLLIRYGGFKAYRKWQPFFLGLILGDFINGGFWTLVGCLVPIRVYPVNW